ncbi:PorP/SprF family type IX secretion system membrane protein [Fulvivirga lutimaris]|uniref:PorP/SprF family type IX secretion system membrane protein n=1 Tax=Fulvivirga lutimaris TaxID=1819566 RepID=UPI0012BBE3EF|nr:type IX secretion system membrane protein PorP/SprF [Fulvivirga lutimaris]MTI40606.1 type IX secretion system membrane protein PorP/SprF [Fulvivirga lutimaris]
MKKAINHNVLLIICISCMLASKSVIAQQNVQYTQYMYDGSLINPAYVGADEALSMTLVHRDQWNGLDGAPQSQTFSAHTLFKKKQFGTGIIIHRESIGIHQSFNAGANFAYHLPTGRYSYLSFGMQAAAFSRQSDYQAVQGTTMDPSAINGDYKETFFDASFGLYFRSKKFHMGYSASEILPRDYILGDTLAVNSDNFSHLVFTKLILPLSRSVDLTPSVLLKYYAGTPLSYDLNLNTTIHEVISLGVSYRKDESVDFLVRLNITPQFQVGYAYDNPIGSVADFAKASNELMLRYLFKFKYDKVVSPR